MKKTIIASKQQVGNEMHVDILILNTEKCTIERKTFYNGRIFIESTTYYECDEVLDVAWESEILYFQENKYSIITLY